MTLCLEARLCMLFKVSAFMFGKYVISRTYLGRRSKSITMVSDMFNMVVKHFYLVLPGSFAD